MQKQTKLVSFEEAVLPHLDAGYNLARWLTRNEADAEDVVQEAYLRAFKFFAGFRGADARSWLLAIVRNTCYTWMQQNRSRELSVPLDDEHHELEAEDLNPEELLLQSADTTMVTQALEELPVEFREVLVLRSWKKCRTKRSPVLLIYQSAQLCLVWRVVASGCSRFSRVKCMWRCKVELSESKGVDRRLCGWRIGSGQQSGG